MHSNPHRWPAVFFDIGETLGSAVISPPPHRLQRLDVYPYIPAVLEDLRDRGARLGIISNTGEEREDRLREVLVDAGIFDFFDSALLVYSAEVGLTKDSPEIFRLAARLAGMENHLDLCLFVGEDSWERGFALEAGMRVAPHPLLAAAALEGEQMRFVRVSVPQDREGDEWRSALRGLPLIPLHVSADRAARVYAIATEGAAAALDNLRFEVDRLGAVGEPLAADLYLVRDDQAASSGFLSPEGQAQQLSGPEGRPSPILSSTQEGLLVAVPAGHSIEEFHFPQAYHGHNLKLAPDVSLLEPFGVGARAAMEWLAAAVPLAPEPPLDDDARDALAALDADRVRRFVERYAGATPVDDGGTDRITSRHILSADNRRVTEMLARDLERIGRGQLTVRMHRFTHEGVALYNVEAELPGDSTELVLVTAHLDSTAAFSEGYDPRRDSAPGADDDASGVAGVLALGCV
jgi:hypothetical protein